MIKDYCQNVIKRAFLFQFMIIFSVMRLLEAFRFHHDFLKRLTDLVASLHLSPKMLEFLPNDTEILYKAYLITLIVLAAFAILGLRPAQFLAGLACIKTGFIYYNPIKEFQRKEIETQADYLPSFYFLLFLALGFAMMTNAFTCTSCEKSPDDQSIQIEMADQKKRNDSPSSDKKKKKVI